MAEEEKLENLHENAVESEQSMFVMLFPSPPQLVQLPPGTSCSGAVVVSVVSYAAAAQCSVSIGGCLGSCRTAVGQALRRGVVAGLAGGCCAVAGRSWLAAPAQ